MTDADGIIAAARALRPGRVKVDGKFFSVHGERFDFKGITYGTFAAREDGALFPDAAQVKLDFEAMAENGFTVVRTYTAPPQDVLDAAADWGLRILAGAFYPDWRYLLSGSRREHRDVVREAQAEVRRAARALAGRDVTLGLSLGNEIPADVVRWFGTDAISRTISALVEVVREEDPELLVTYGNYPTAEYLPLPDLDFLTFNVFLEKTDDLRRYVTRLHHLAGDRPLVLGEIGLDSGTRSIGEHHQAKVLDRQLETLVERGVAGSCVFSWTDDWTVGGMKVEGWHFGLTRADRSEKPAMAVARKWNHRTVRDLEVTWPKISVVICAYNAAATMDECLQYTCALDYPNLEIIVVDDGSTDDTAEITRRHERAILVPIAHAGLSVARNEGYLAATGEIVAYLDSDAYPAPEWPYYLALGFDSEELGGVGGPNVPPLDDPLGAHVVARAPGGPVHVLTSDDRAEHIPGCNMAFRKHVLVEAGGFNPVYDAAGDDVDLCWRLLDAGWEIGFHPAALVWHHRRPGLKKYLRQQRGYGRSEALVEARHPHRFTTAGTARWAGRIYNSLTPSFGKQRIYRGAFGSASYQSVYQGGGYALDIAHQAGVPIAAMVLPTAVFGFVSWWLALPALIAAVFLVVLAGIDMARAVPPRSLERGHLAFKANVAAHHLLQPIVRSWSRRKHRGPARQALPELAPLPEPLRWLDRNTVLLEEDRQRADLAAGVIDRIRRSGVRAEAATGWEDFDSRLYLSPFVNGDLQTSSHPIGFVQVRIRPRLRARRLAAALAAAAIVAVANVFVGAAFAVTVLGATAYGARRCRTTLQGALKGRNA